jgi:hypothetical protein
MQNLSICLSDIPESKITKGKNGKKYFNITTDTRREPDNFGNDLSVFISQTKEERTSRQPKIYVGSGKTFNFERREQPEAPATKAEYPINKHEAPTYSGDSNEPDDLPF